MKALLKIFPITEIPPMGFPKQYDIVLCKQFQNEYRIYKITKKWSPLHYDLEVLFENEFRTYGTILSVPKPELFMIGCEFWERGEFPIDRANYLRQYPLMVTDYEYALPKIGEEVEIELKEHKEVEDDVVDGIWNYPICKIIKQ